MGQRRNKVFVGSLFFILKKELKKEILCNARAYFFPLFLRSLRSIQTEINPLFFPSDCARWENEKKKREHVIDNPSNIATPQLHVLYKLIFWLSICERKRVK